MPTDETTLERLAKEYEANATAWERVTVSDDYSQRRAAEARLIADALRYRLAALSTGTVPPRPDGGKGNDGFEPEEFPEDEAQERSALALARYLDSHTTQGLLPPDGARVDFSYSTEVQGFQSEETNITWGELRAALYRAALTAPAAQEGATITEYTLGDMEDRDRSHLLVRVRYSGRGKWAVCRLGDVLNRDGEWEWEPLPSSRDDAFFARCRFDSAADAIAAARKVLAASLPRGGDEA